MTREYKTLAKMLEDELDRASRAAWRGFLIALGVAASVVVLLLAAAQACGQTFRVSHAEAPRRFVITHADTDAPAQTWGQVRAEAIRESKPLVVWIGYRCPSSAVQVPGMLHFFPPGDEWHGRRGPGVWVAVPGGDGELYSSAWIPAADCCATNIRAAVEATLKGWEGGTVPPPSVGVLHGASAPSRLTGAAGQARLFAHVRGWTASRDGNCVG